MVVFSGWQEDELRRIAVWWTKFSVWHRLMVGRFHQGVHGEIRRGIHRCHGVFVDVEWNGDIRWDLYNGNEFFGVGREAGRWGCCHVDDYMFVLRRRERGRSYRLKRRFVNHQP